MSYIRPVFLGILAAIAALVLEQAASIALPGIIDTEIILKISWMVIFAILIEEILKYFLIYKNSLKLASRYEIIISAFFLGGGFSLVEIFLYTLSKNPGLETIFWPLLGVALIHLATSGFSGYLISKRQNIYLVTSRALIINIFFHFLYNFAILNIF